MVPITAIQNWQASIRQNRRKILVTKVVEQNGENTNTNSNKNPAINSLRNPGLNPPTNPVPMPIAKPKTPFFKTD